MRSASRIDGRLIRNSSSSSSCLGSRSPSAELAVDDALAQDSGDHFGHPRRLELRRRPLPLPDAAHRHLRDHDSSVRLVDAVNAEFLLFAKRRWRAFVRPDARPEDHRARSAVRRACRPSRRAGRCRPLRHADLSPARRARRTQPPRRCGRAGSGPATGWPPACPTIIDVVAAFHGAQRIGAVWVGIGEALTETEQRPLVDDCAPAVVLAGPQCKLSDSHGS